MFFFEFLIGLTVLWGMEQAVILGKTPLTVEAGKIFVVVLGCMVAVFIQADYDYIGIIIIAAFYEISRKQSRAQLVGSCTGRVGNTGFKLRYRGTGSNTYLVL